MPIPEIQRRPLKTRGAHWAIALALLLIRLRVTPNAISLLSVVAAATSGGCFLWSSLVRAHWHQALLLLGAAICIQIRLLCNMLDGMVAIEGKRRTPTGELFNEIPDRLADMFILVGAGYAARPHLHAIDIGWLCALLAVLTAYLRALGQSLGAKANYLGPMAKPQRMALMTGAAAIASFATIWSQASLLLWLALMFLALGTVVTCTRRTRAIAQHLTQ
jgi:phosphatidylglycerophosphate synthase